MARKKNISLDLKRRARILFLMGGKYTKIISIYRSNGVVNSQNVPDQPWLFYSRCGDAGFFSVSQNCFHSFYLQFPKEVLPIVFTCPGQVSRKLPDECNG